VKRYRIAVEKKLSNIEQMLKEEGYDVGDVDDLGSYADAVIITGMDEDVAGYANILTDGIVVDASGRQPEEVLYEIERNFRLKDKE